MATICKHEGKKEDILQQESCTRTSCMFLEAMKVAQAASKTTELISIDGGVFIVHCFNSLLSRVELLTKS